jgi:Protein of unknown function (DUF1592)/Protein of unknown function (DUF1588)/Protein of unknown function (DUF1587)/Protein of unknown function (DUF1595)/Protein of unknown function (DUF1585)
MIGRWAVVGIAFTMGAQSAAIDPAFFVEKLYPVLEAAQCRLCHARDGVASATRVHFPEKEARPQEIQLFGMSLEAVVDRADPSKSLLRNKPTNRVKHTGGERIKPGSDEEKLLLAWVDYLATSPEQSLEAVRRRLAAGTGVAKQNQLVRRLTHSQYNNTVRDLLGDSSRPAQRFPPEDYVDGFKNQLRHQSMPPLLVEGYSTAAEKLAANAFRAGDVNGLIPCKPQSAVDIKCRDQFVKSFGLRAFRRPLRDAELQKYAAAFSLQARATGKFLEGARVVVEAMLQSPKFLFHTEAGADGRSVDYAIASRLSYFLWDTMPDKKLLEMAGRGALRSPSAREREARRLLASPQAAEALDEFFNQWLRFDRVLNASKERRRFPEFTPEMAAGMVEETRRLLQHLSSTNGNFMELLTADYGFLSSDLASMYRLPAPATQFALVRFPLDARRAGLLGQGSFLAATAGPAETSPTARGIFVREQLLCQHVPPPPPNVNTTLPEPTEGKPLTHRQRLAAHVENAACASCHRLMDPIGFGLESFDAIGRWREKEIIFIAADTPRGQPKKIDLPLETGGEIAGLPNSAFNDAKQLGGILAASPVCQECIVRQIFRYAYGRLETAADQETIHQLFMAFRDAGFHFQELLIGLVKSQEFSRGLDDNSSQAARR